MGWIRIGVFGFGATVRSVENVSPSRLLFCSGDVVSSCLFALRLVTGLTDRSSIHTLASDRAGCSRTASIAANPLAPIHKFNQVIRHAPSSIHASSTFTPIFAKFAVHFSNTSLCAFRCSNCFRKLKRPSWSPCVLT